MHMVPVFEDTTEMGDQVRRFWRGGFWPVIWRIEPSK